MSSQLRAGTKVVDRDGFAGTIVAVTNWEGSTWYDVRFATGTAVRYESDLCEAEDPITRAGRLACEGG